MSNTYGVGYTISKFEQTLAEHSPLKAKNLDFRREIAERNLKQALEKFSKAESRPHQIIVDEWVSYETEVATFYQKKGRLVLTD